MEHFEDAEPEPPRRPSRTLRRRMIGLAAAGGLVLAGFGVAGAQTDRTSTSRESEPPAAGAEPAEPAHGGPGKRIFLRGGPGFGPHGFGPPGGGIHSETTTKNPDGDGYRTVAGQTGEVTDVSSSSLEVRSEDGYERTYVIDEDTLVNAGKDGIGSVKKGDQVRVMAIVEGDKARAVHVSDVTNLERLREKWWPKPKRTR